MEPSLNLSVCSDVSCRTSLQPITAVVIMCTVVLDMTPSQVVYSYRCLGNSCHSCLQGTERETCPEMAAAGSSETSVSIEQPSWRLKALDLNLLRNSVTGPAHTELGD
jgi:hypothetical protein